MSLRRFSSWVSWRFTRSICFLVWSSALMTFLFRISRSRRRSSIFFRSASTSFFWRSASFWSPFSSSFSSLRAASNCRFSRSTSSVFFLQDSCIFIVFSRLERSWLISSSFARFRSSRSEFSLSNLSFFCISWSSFCSQAFLSSSSLACSVSSLEACASVSRSCCSVRRVALCSCMIFCCLARNSVKCSSCWARRAFSFRSSPSLRRCSASASLRFWSRASLIDWI
mmetsp:Transcript_12932/g.29445  ORF Transcript_12932/g.29445 Transcript_12932/m.29445 type:complete len:226 (+) Transcript_12932:1441-2118(+)